MWLSMAVGLLTGLISGCGIGGGTLLILYLTMVQGVGQIQAQGVNLWYFLCCAPPAIWYHYKHRLIRKKAAVICSLSGAASASLFSLVAHGLDVTLVKRGFGCLLLYIGAKEFLGSKKEKKQRSEQA